MAKLTGICLLLAVLNFALAEDTYFKDGGSLTLDLRPPSTETITNILWKFNGNLLAEWVDQVIPLRIYAPFTGRATLDTKTGSLTINNTGKGDVGEYSVEINTKVQSERYGAVLIKEVPQPEVWISPLTCAPGAGTCKLTCGGETADARPVTYWWKMGDGDWEESEKFKNITEADHADVKTFTCLLKNPLGEKASEPVDNLLFREEEPGSSKAGKIVGGVMGGLFLVGAAVAGGVVAWKKGVFNKKATSTTGAASENGQPLTDTKPPPSPSDNSSKPPAPEEEALTDNPDPQPEGDSPA